MFSACFARCHSFDVGRDVIYGATRIMARMIHSKKEYNKMHTSTCKVTLHLKGLVITLGIMHTGHNLSHTVDIITFTFRFHFPECMY